MKHKKLSIFIIVGITLILIIGLVSMCSAEVTLQGVEGYKDKTVVSFYTLVWIPDTVRRELAGCNTICGYGIRRWDNG